jgi:integral membrane protein (TIGR01906 family)
VKLKNFELGARNSKLGTLLGALRFASVALLALALPVFLVTNGVRWVALDEGFYLEEFTRYDVGRSTGLPRDELRKIAGAFVQYFQTQPGPLLITATFAGGPSPLFNDREIRHMADVQIIMGRVLATWRLAVGAIVLSSCALLAMDHFTGSRSLALAGAIGGAISVGAVGALSLATLADFGQLFLQFHFMSFSNDLWILDPARDHLIQLFPQGFFFDSAVRIGFQTVALGIAVLAISGFALFLPAPRAETR